MWPPCSTGSAQAGISIVFAIVYLTPYDTSGNPSIVFVFVSCSQTYLVTGGYHTGNVTLASTELLRQDASQWVYSGELPSARYALRGATLANKLIMTGEYALITP